MASTTATKETIIRATGWTEEEPLVPDPEPPLPPAVGWEAAMADMEATAGARSGLGFCEAAGV